MQNVCGSKVVHVLLNVGRCDSVTVATKLRDDKVVDTPMMISAVKTNVTP